MPRKQDLDALVKRLGGRFKLTVLIQKRIQDLARGAAPLVETAKEGSLIDVAIEEIAQGKVAYDLPEEEAKPRKAKKE